MDRIRAPTSNSRYIHAPIFLFEILASSWVVGLLDPSHGAGFGLDMNFNYFKMKEMTGKGREKMEGMNMNMGEVGEKMKRVGENVKQKMTETIGGMGENLGVGGRKVDESVGVMGEKVDRFGHNAVNKVGETKDHLNAGARGTGNKTGEVGEGVGEVGKSVGKGEGQVSQDVGKGVGEVGKGVDESVNLVGSYVSTTTKGTLGGVTNGIQSVGPGGGVHHPLDGVEL